MGMCNTHAEDLRGALRKKGLGNYLQARDSDHVSQLARWWLEGAVTKNTPERFDAYIVAALEIYKKRDEVLPGLAPVARARCPLCLIARAITNKTTMQGGADFVWIDNVTDAILVMAKVNEFVR